MTFANQRIGRHFALCIRDYNNPRNYYTRYAGQKWVLRKPPQLSNKLFPACNLFVVFVYLVLLVLQKSPLELKIKRQK